MRPYSRLVFLALLGLLSFSLACPKGGALANFVLTAPAHGSFTTAGSVAVTGQATGKLGQIMELTVNGVSVLPLAPDNTFSTSVILDPVAIFNPIVVELSRHNGTKVRQRVTVVAGDSIPDGDLSPMGIAMRLNDSGLDAVEPVMTSLVTLDLATLMPPGTLIVDNFCYQDSIFGCIGRVDATVSGSPPPSIGSFAIDVDSQTDFVDGDILLNNLFIRANVFAVTGIGFSCTVDVSAATTDIRGDYGLGSDAGLMDVTQLGGVGVVFGGFNDSTDCDGFLGFIVEAFISLLVGDLQNNLIRPAFEDFLNTTDPQGNTPIAAAIETALNDVEISGPIGEAIGVNLETPLYDVFEDVDGITLDSDARITASLPDPLAPDLLASYHIPEAFPTFGPNTPGGTPYGMGLCISTSAFNQLLKAEVESGLLRSALTELDFGGGPFPITAAFLASLVPEFGVLDPATLLRIDISPTMAPVVTGSDGPLGELAEMRVPHLLVDIVIDANDELLLSFAVDATLGLEIDFVAGQLSFQLGTLLGSNLGITILENTLSANEPFLEGLLTALLPVLFPSLADSLGTFPLPDFLGLQLQLVEIGKSGEFMSLFVDLVPVP
jgi:hypothetical protein